MGGGGDSRNRNRNVSFQNNIHPADCVLICIIGMFFSDNKMLCPLLFIITFHLLPTGSEERGVLWVGSIPDAIPPS